jgi:excisionase family DNA binding protein
MQINCNFCVFVKTREEVAMREFTRLLTVQEAERITGRKASTWRKDILTRKVPVVRIGRQVRIPLEAIQDLIRKGYHAPVALSPEDVE